MFGVNPFKTNTQILFPYFFLSTSVSQLTQPSRKLNEIRLFEKDVPKIGLFGNKSSENELTSSMRLI